MERDKSRKTGDFHQVPTMALPGNAIDVNKSLKMQGKYIVAKPVRWPRQRPNLQRPTDLA
jgi:hypothetical protein